LPMGQHGAHGARHALAVLRAGGICGPGSRVTSQGRFGRCWGSGWLQSKWNGAILGGEYSAKIRDELGIGRTANALVPRRRRRPPSVCLSLTLGWSARPEKVQAGGGSAFSSSHAAETAGDATARGEDGRSRRMRGVGTAGEQEGERRHGDGAEISLC
jgi:hypothetical protein